MAMCWRSWPALREPTHLSAPSSWRTLMSITLTSETKSIMCHVASVLNDACSCNCLFGLLLSLFPFLLLSLYLAHLCSFPSLLLVLLLSLFCLDLSCPPTLWSIVTLCITLYSWRGCFPPPCILLFSCCTAWKIYLHGVWFTVGFLYNFQTEPAVYSADLKNETKYKMPDCDSWCFSVFPGAMCRGRIGGSWGLSWTGIIMRCLWRSQAAWSVCRWAAALSTATARSESTIQ